MRFPTEYGPRRRLRLPARESRARGTPPGGLAAACGAALLAVLAACSGDSSSSGSGGSGPAGEGPSVPVAQFDSELAVRWGELVYQRVEANSTDPASASRVYAYTAVALYEALVPGMPDRATLQGRLNGLAVGDLPAPGPERHHWPTAANRAVAVVASALLPASAAQFGALEVELLAGYEGSEAPAVIDRSILYGDALGHALVAWAATDGAAGQAACTAGFVAPLDPAFGGWVPVPPNAFPPILPCWGDQRTFVVTGPLECAPAGPPTYSIAPASAFRMAALSVYQTTGDSGANLTADQRAAAFHWADNASATGTQAGHWIAIACQIASEDDVALDQAADVLARVGIAVADAMVTTWDAKTTHYLKRPVTYIREVIDPGWDPLLPPPNFPSYSSDHATVAGAAATVLTAAYGARPFTDTTHTRLNANLGLPARDFADFLAAAGEASVARVYAGIHYPFDGDDGLDSGVCVGLAVEAALSR